MEEREPLCPHCESPLDITHHKEIEIDFCPKGHGLWFGEGELRTLILKHQLMDKGKRTKALVLGIPEEATTKKPPESRALGKFPCPYRHGALFPKEYARGTNFFYDICKSCGGVWVEQGDLHALTRLVRGESVNFALGRALAWEVKKREEWRKSQEAQEELRQWRRGYRPTFAVVPIPLFDIERISIFPMVVVSLIALNVVLFFISSLMGIEEFARNFGFVPLAVLSGEIWRSLTSAFLHIDLLHLGSNMYFLWMFGDNVEATLGKVKFLFIYLAGLLGADILHLVMHLGDTTPVIGASGAISGTMGAYLILHPRNRIRSYWINTVVDIPAWEYLIFWFLIQLVLAFIYETAGYSNIAFFAHVGGFAAGGASVWFLRRLPKPQPKTKQAVILEESPSEEMLE